MFRHPAMRHPRRCPETKAAGGSRPRPMAAGCPTSTSRRRPTGSGDSGTSSSPSWCINWVAVLMATPGGQPRVKVPFSPYFLQQVQAGQVKSISAKGDTIKGTFAAKLRYPPDDKKATPTTLFATQVPEFWDSISLTEPAAGQEGPGRREEPEPRDLGAAGGPARLRPDAAADRAVLVLRAPRSGRRRTGRAWAASVARRPGGSTRQQIRVTFDDVAGIDEAKAELTEIVDFLKSPDRYTRLGGRMPHGVLLYGPPGTGKTLLARAVAGEAHAAFFSIAASEFIEAIVGVGAVARPRPVRQGQGGRAGDHLHRRARRDRPLAPGVGGDQRRQRRARADARPDPDRDGRLRVGRGRRRARRDQPARRSSTRRCCGPGASTAESRSSRPTAPGGGRFSTSTRGRYRWPTTSTSTRWRRRRPGWSAPIWPISPTRRRCSPPVATTTQVHDGRLHRLAREDPARRSARHRSQPGRPRANGLPRVRARAGRDADRGRRSGAQGLDHPARLGPRCHLLGARLRPRLVFARGARGEDPGLARRPRGRGGGLRRDQHRRRIRPPAADPDRARDGRALGDERQARPDHVDPERRPGTIPARRQRNLAADAVAGRRGGPPPRR